MFEILHDDMLQCLKNSGRTNLDYNLQYSKIINNDVGLESPVQFNQVSKAVLSAQASSACLERLFRGLGRMKGNKR